MSHYSQRVQIFAIDLHTLAYHRGGSDSDFAARCISRGRESWGLMDIDNVIYLRENNMSHTGNIIIEKKILKELLSLSITEGGILLISTNISSIISYLIYANFSFPEHL